MSSDSAQWPVVAPGFMYIVKMGDFTHILQPADQRSSENLNLAQQAIRDINVARRLLNERGPFLLLDKQQKMDELISETEDAINRVIKILEPSRVEHISEQESIRFNTRNPWTLQNDPKSAATFSRLSITHDALKTVVHELNNIEDTAQQDDCNIRANPAPGTAATRPAQHPMPTTTADTATATAPPPPVVPLGVVRSNSRDARSLITWRRSRRANRSARHDPNVQSNTSSISETTIDDNDLNDILSPVSPVATRPRRQSIPTTPVSLQSDTLPDLASDAPALPIIHELDGGVNIVRLGPVRPSSPITNEKTHQMANGKAPTPLVQHQKVPDSIEAGQVRDVKPSSHQHNPSNSPPTLRVTPPTLKQPKGVRRETLGEYRQRGRESRQMSNSVVTSGPQLPFLGEQEGMNDSHQEPVDARQQTSGRFHSLRGRSPAGRTKPDTIVRANPVLANGEPPQTPVGQMISPPSNSGAEGSGPIMNQVAQHQGRGRQEFQDNSERSIGPVRPATYPPLKTQLQPPPRSPARGNGSPNSSNQILSPSRSQMSPQEQTQSPDTTSKPLEPHTLQPHLRNPQIFAIDPELTKMPSVLRAARTRQEARSTLPASQSSSRNREELHIPRASPSDLVKNPMDRSTTAPPLLNTGGNGSDTFSQPLPSRDDLAHLRSMSDTDVPQVDADRAPIIPRKPLPYQNLTPRNVSPVNVSRISTPMLTRPQSEMNGAISVGEQSLKHTSGPPSPVHSDHPGTLAPQRPRATSFHSLSIQASAGSSRRSSISAEEPTNINPSALDRPQKTNGLAMNPPAISPPEIPERQTSAYQAQQMVQLNQSTQLNQPAQVNQPVQISQPTQINQAVHNNQPVHNDQSAQIAVQTPDYRSPAWQQARHYFGPGHDRHPGQATLPNPETTSRFRDQDQSQTVPISSNHTRSHTVPVPGPEIRAQTFEVNQTSRLTAPAHRLLPSQQAMHAQSPPKPSPSPRPSEHQQKASFLHHQAARLQSRQHPSPNLPPGALQAEQEQAVPLQPPPPPTVITLTPMQMPPTPRAAPRVDPNQKARAIHQKPANHGRATSLQIERPASKPAVGDKDLFDRQVFRPSIDRQPAAAAASSIPAPTSAPPPPPAPAPAPSQGVSHHTRATMPQHDCHCDDEQHTQSHSQPQPQPQLQPPLQPQLSSQPRLQSQPQAQLQSQPQPQPRLPPPPPPPPPPATKPQPMYNLVRAPNGVPQIVPVTAPPDPRIDMPQVTSRQQKKKSWLAHQAGKISARPGN